MRWAVEEEVLIKDVEVPLDLMDEAVAPPRVVTSNQSSSASRPAMQVLEVHPLRVDLACCLPEVPLYRPSHRRSSLAKAHLRPSNKHRPPRELLAQVDQAHLQLPQSTSLHQLWLVQPLRSRRI